MFECITQLRRLSFSVPRLFLSLFLSSWFKCHLRVERLKPSLLIGRSSTTLISFWRLSVQITLIWKILWNRTYWRLGSLWLSFNFQRLVSFSRTNGGYFLLINCLDFSRLWVLSIFSHIYSLIKDSYLATSSTRSGCLAYVIIAKFIKSLGVKSSSPPSFITSSSNYQSILWRCLSSFGWN